MKSTFLTLTLVLSFSLTQVAFSAPPEIMTTAEIQKLIGRYPSKGSVEEKADFDQMLKLQQTRTAADCQAAAEEVKPNIRTLFTRDYGPLTEDEMNQAYPKIEKVYQAASSTCRYAKSIYKRPRPYISNPSIKPCIELENSYAFPSGHTTISRAVARALSVLYPERAELLMERADQTAFHRVLGGVHHPTDIAAGKKLGDEVAKRIEVTE